MEKSRQTETDNEIEPKTDIEIHRERETEI